MDTEELIGLIQKLNGWGDYSGDGDYSDSELQEAIDLEIERKGYDRATMFKLAKSQSPYKW